MEGLIFKKQIVFLLVLALLTTCFFVFTFAQSNEINPPSVLNYAPNFQFDVDEKYYPADPLDFYFENGEEIEGEKAVNKYNQLSLEAKLNNLTVFYHIEDEGNHWVYQYWTFYILNNSLGKIRNQHYGDWEAVFVFVDKETKKVIKTIGTAHQRKLFDTEIINPGINHIWAYIGNGSHAICIDNENDDYCDFFKWRSLEKWDKGGVEVKYGDYNLIEVTSDFINKFAEATTLKKSPELGMKINSLKPLGIYNIPIGGSPPNHPWTQSMYNNPEDARPYSVKYAGEKIKKAGSGIASFFGGLADKVTDLFQKSAPLQPAGIGGALFDNPVFEIDNDLAVVSVEEEDIPIQVQESPALIIVEEIGEKLVEPVVVEKKEQILIEEEIKETKENEPISQSDIPYSYSSPIGGGAPLVETDPDPDPDPDTDSEVGPPNVIPAPAITSHSNGDVLGLADDYSTSTAGFQINLIGTSTPDFLIHISASSTLATTTADSNGDWNKVIDLEEGNNNITAQAEDADSNESEETSLNLIVDTNPPSDISNLSAISGDTRGTIGLSWTAPGDDESVGTTTQYIIRYATSSAITADNWDSSTEITNELIPNIASTTESLIISELETSETYYWAIKSEDDAGNTSEISNCASSSPSAIAENIVISEIAVQGGNGVKDEFIELYNPTNQSIDLNNWSIQYRGGGATSFQKKNLVAENLIPKNGYFLIAHSNYDGYTVADMSHSTFSLSGGGGTVFLVNDQIDLTSATSSSIIDKISYGSGDLFPEKTEFSLAPGSEQSLERKAFATSTAELLAVNNSHHWKGNNQDSNNNSQDFVLQATSSPQNSFSLTEPETVYPVLADTAWPMLQHDVRHSGLGAYTGTATGTPTSTPKWEINLESGSPTSPIIGPDREIYIGASNGKLYRVDTTNETVELFYDTQTGRTIQTPTLASDGTIYIADNHYLYAISPEGQLKWKYNILDSSPPTIASDGVIYIGSGYYGIYALNPNGELIWQSPQLSNGSWVKSPVLDSNGVIYAVSRIGTGDNSKNIYALNPQDGSIDWESAPGTFSTAPSLSNDETILVGGKYGLYAINSSDGIQKWSLLAPSSIGSIYSSIPAIKDNTIYVGTDSHALRAINKAEEKIKWSFYSQGKFSASPIIDAAGTIYIGSKSGMFYAFNPVDGSVKWQAELDGAINSSAVIGADGIIYVSSDNGTLYAFGE